MSKNSEMPSPVALKLRKVRHVFGETVAVDEFSIDVAEGEVVCLLGLPDVEDDGVARGSWP